MFVCPIDIPPVPIQEMDNTGEVLPPTGEFCGYNSDGVPMKCLCTAEEYENHAPLFGDHVIPVIPYDSGLPTK